MKVCFVSIIYNRLLQRFADLILLRLQLQVQERFEVDTCLFTFLFFLQTEKVKEMAIFLCIVTYTILVTYTFVWSGILNSIGYKYNNCQSMGPID